MMRVDWTTFKGFIDDRSLSVQYVDINDAYYLKAIDGNFSLDCKIQKDDPATSDQTDFEDNYKAAGNATFSDAGGSTIVRTHAFNNTDDLKFRGTGVSGTATKNATSNIDYVMPENRFINGVDLLIKDHVWGDKIDFQVVDVDNILGYGAGVVLDEFGKDWYVDPDKCGQGQIRVEYPALVYAGLYIRIKYHSVGTVDDVLVKCNMFLHK